jgi:hypothetical protein
VVLSMEKKREYGLFWKILAYTIGVISLAAVMSSCGTSPGYSVTVGGTVSGLSGGGELVLHHRQWSFFLCHTTDQWDYIQNHVERLAKIPELQCLQR